MRILIAHEALSGAGGVESYLSFLVPALRARGHEVALLHYNHGSDGGPTPLQHPGVPTFGVLDEGLDVALKRAVAWRPDICFSHNMGPLAVDAALAAAFPTVKMMHGYFGTCVSGHKAHGYPATTPCERTLGAACAALYIPRRCGERRPMALVRGFVQATRQRTLFAHYRHFVVASRHMRAEYARHGVSTDRITVAPLFPTAVAVNETRPLPSAPAVLFAGRMTALKGGDVLIRAISEASRRLGQSVSLVAAGDGPERGRWAALAAALGVNASFTGWVSGEALARLTRNASVMAVPSLWPEPFGLVGLEAAQHGVPAVAFDSGGISQWLRDDVNGRLVRPTGDVTAFAMALAELLGDPALMTRLGRGAARAAREMSLDAHVEQLQRVFTAVSC